MAIAKVIYNDPENNTTETWMDVTQDTVSTGTLVNPETATKNDGTQITGAVMPRDSSDLTVSGNTVTAPAGVYSSAASKSVATTTHPNPTVSVNTSTGLVTASHTQGTGYVTGGTTTGTTQLSTQAGTTITPTESEQTAVAAGKFTTGAVKVGAISPTYVGSGITQRSSSDLSASGGTITAPAGYYESAASKSVAAMTLPTAAASTSSGTSKATIGRSTSDQYINIPVGYNGTAAYYKISAVPNGTAGTPTATKGTVSNHSIAVTPSVTNATGYIEGGTKAGTPVTVSASELVSGSQTITSNQTVDVTNLQTIVVDVAGGGGTPTAEESDVNFIDYDGTILYSYTVADFANLSALPANPSHSGLTAQGWNWTLSDAKSYVADYGGLVIGQSYITDDGKTRIYITLFEGATNPLVGLAVNGTAVVDWGDGSATSTLTGSSETTAIFTSNHQYATAGDYVITINVTSGKARLSGYSNGNGAGAYILRQTSATDQLNNIYQRRGVTKIEIGANMDIGGQAFNTLYSLESVTIPTGCLFYNTQYTSNIYQCYNLKAIVVPNGVTSIPQYCFGSGYLQWLSLPGSITTMLSQAVGYNYTMREFYMPPNMLTTGNSGNSLLYGCTSLVELSIPKTWTAIPSSLLSGCGALVKLEIPSLIATINTSAFSSLSGLREMHFKPTSPPTAASTNCFTSLPTTCIIYVPTGSLSAYTSATNYPDPNTYTYVEE